MREPSPAVLFVCLGNICRSPLAEAAFRMEAENAALMTVVDSAGTGDWHNGQAPDPRAQAAALRNGIDISGYRARQVNAADFRRFSHILALDRENLRDLEGVRPAGATAELGLLMDLVPGQAGRDVTDPYFGDDSGFDVTWADVTAAALALVERLKR